jgi:tetratricopeptide (TPR) repeat protein/archaellum biogenesis ATPase FlaH
MKCPHCQAENREGRKFCSSCGKPLQVTCPSCGAINEPGESYCGECGHALTQAFTKEQISASPSATTAVPASFANGRYQVKKFLGEGGKKKVYLAHDTELDRDVAFALIKTEKLDESARTRIKREAQAMGKLGDHPNIVSIFDIGDQEGQPFIVIPFMAGGDVEGLIKKAPDHKLPVDKSIEITKSVCKGLEFAHAKGIIHRDIKPGNIWLNAEGNAQIGDFGLAVAIDMSRLTQAGMMVGTVSYMPPEQAMGGKVTAKADLYSLGAMLYEMVTGRPPFIGDDSVAIIGQHINTPPVSPTWHRADLPPSLETLIIQLLEKDPEKRPQSTTVVLQALESIGTIKAPKEPVKEAVAATENPIYRKVFVGREAELKQLQSAFDGAMSGQGALMMVLGEPGIGKTALCEQLATWVTLRGGRTLVGHCYEEGSLSLPYLAFVEAMRSYVLSRDVKNLREELGTGAVDVARIVSDIRERLKIKLRVPKDPDEERYRLMQSVTTFLTNAACMQPLLLVLEDLHDADKGTLDMLTHVSRNLAGARLLIVGTYRDIEVDRTHPLSAALADLRRVSTYGRVILRGLNADEVRRMLESITRENMPWSLAEAVHRQTEGNPLFVQEVIRYLNEEGLIKREGDKWSGKSGTDLEMNIPEGLRDVIGKRVSLLSKECNQLLSMASVIGREFSLETLKAVAGVDETIFVNALKEAVRLSVLEERPQVGSVRYRFTHAFFRQTLYEEMIAPQRLQSHQLVARALEAQYAGRLEEHASELAEHYSQSTDRADLAKAVSYGKMAANRAMDVYAYGEAARLLDQAIKVQKVLNPGAKEEICDLLLDLCDVLLEVPDNRRIYSSEAPEAFALAENIGDSSRAVRACSSAVFAIGNESAAGYASPEWAQWAMRADKLAHPDTVDRVMADFAVGVMKSMQGDLSSAYSLYPRAYELACRLDDGLALSLAGNLYIQSLSAPQHSAESLKVVDDMWSRLRPKLTVRTGYGSLLSMCGAFLAAGLRNRANEICTVSRDLAKKSANIRIEIQCALMDSVMATIDGRFEEAVKLAEHVQKRSEEVNFSGLSYYLSQIRVNIYMGLPIETIVSKMPLVSIILAPIGLAYSSRFTEAEKSLEGFLTQRMTLTAPNEVPAYWDISILETSVLIKNRQIAEMMLDRFSGKGVYTSGIYWITCVPRHLGGAAALLGRYDEARQHYQEAIRVCTEMRFRPELALTHLQLAELLLDHYPDEKKDALEHLDFAIKEFREMKMQPSLERALRHKEILKA